MERQKFYHPFEPYDIQRELMQAVYDCIEDGKVGIFESPTGTGKSLSLICASLTWLREHKRKTFDASLEKIQVDNDEPEWMLEHARKSCIEDAMQLRADFEDRLARIRRKEAKLRQKSAAAHKKARVEESTVQSEDAFMLDDYESDSESKTPTNGSALSAETQQMLMQLGMLWQEQEDRSEEDSEEKTKVFICSRTHSQLAQFVGELHRVSLPSSLPGKDEDVTESLKQLSLGSRRNLCINPDVQKLQRQTAINERCLELQSSSKTAERCSFAPKHDKPKLLLDFRDHALASIRDIEELAEVGRGLKICPYYASRAALGPAEVVLLPYPLLLQRTAREATGISLTGSVVIIDEAHNLMAAVESAHGSSISERQLTGARQGLLTYLQKFRSRLAGSNRTYMAQLLKVVSVLLTELQALKGTSGVIEPRALLSNGGVDQINLSKLARYIGESKIARKVQGYTQYVMEAQRKDGTTAGMAQAETPLLITLQSFLTSLANPSAEGRFFWERASHGATVKYMLLDPAEHFREIAEDARAVILAGGTMSPMEDHIRHLFPYLSDIRTLSCCHIVPANSIFVRTIAGDDIGPIEYTYKTRSDTRLAARTGQMLLQVLSTTSGGMVVFFASYAYLDFVKTQWERDGTLRRVKAVRATYFDSRIQSAEETFQQYTASVHDKESALLFSVIGGKLSEGINFSDNLGRCVVVIGMPYPNLETPEWKAKLEHIKSRRQASGIGSGAELSRDFAENTCMRAVNQAVGRAIRHKKDWASILLIDERYARPRIQGKLPAWIRASLPISGTAGQTNWQKDLRSFFNEKVS